MRARFMVMAAVTAIAALGACDASAQCALCRDSVSASSPATREAFNYAIIGLAFAPYGVAGLAAWALSPSLRSSIRRRLFPREPGVPDETRS